MPTAELVNDRIEIITEYVDKDLIRSVPGASWDPQRHVWHCPPSWGSCVVLRGVFGPRLAIGPALEAWAWHERQHRVEPCLYLRSYLDGVELGDQRQYPFQQAGTRFLSVAREALLGDEMGCGKTSQAICAVTTLDVEHGADPHLGPYPVLCVVPNSTKRSWEREWRAWGAPGVETFVVSGSATQRVKTLQAAAEAERAVVIVNWEAVRLHSRLAPYGSIRLQRCLEHGGDESRSVSRCEVHPKELNDLGFHTVIADEAHKMKDPKSKQTRAVWAVQHGPTVRYRYALTGTPIANHPGDLWSLMHGVAPGDYPSKTRFVDRYALLSWNTFGGLDIIGVRPDTRDEFFRVLDPRFRRMPKDLVLAHLPPKLRTVRYAEMTPKQRRAYKELEKTCVTQLEDGRLVLATNSMLQALRLLQFSSAYAEVDDLGHVHLSEPSSKVDVLLEVLEEAGDRSVVACAESRQLIELASARLTKLGIHHALIVGGMNDDQRAAALDQLQSGQVRVLLFTIKAGGVGLTMTAADTIVFLQRSWSMLDNLQAEDRAHRIGSERHESISIIDVVAPGTIEEEQIARLGLKLARLEEIVRDKQTMRDAGRLDLVTQLEREESEITTSDLADTGLEPAREEVA